MDARELLQNWPVWSKANAETILSSPAWRLPVKFGDGERMLTAAPEAEDGGEILLDVAFDDERYQLGLSDAEVYGDLHLLWARRAELDPSVLLAVIEKDCGSLFQLLEDAVGREFSVLGLASGPKAGIPRRRFAIPELAFSIDLTPLVKVTFGRLECLDVTHESIRSLTRPARYRYASVPLDDAAVAGLAEGDAVVLSGFDSNRWLTELPDDADAHFCAPEETEISFGEFADEALPKPAEDDRLVMIRGGRIVAEGEFSRIGDVRCFKLTHLRS